VYGTTEAKREKKRIEKKRRERKRKGGDKAEGKTSRIENNWERGRLPGY